ncbi:MAG: tRNA 2-thiocytidine biosynthesis protein TtcA [Clostridia bacterium]|nr:tRNA 2-thiocytidine biosynthesis protein TtcA [Clostridia bacterium]
MARDLDKLTPAQRVERSIQKKYRDELWGPFIAGIKEYRLIQQGDRVCVCISGGKDSMLLAKLMQMLQKRSDFPFEVRYLVMDPGYTPANRQKIVDNAALLDIPVEVRQSAIFASVEHVEKNPCYLCARMRRGYLYKYAQELGCNKIALGHHFSDVVETTLMGLLYGSQIQAMMPKLHSKNYPGMELIRPMYRIHEEDIIAWARYNGLSFLQCACRFTEKAETEGRESLSKRKETKALLKELRKTNPDVEKHIFAAIHMVNMDTLLGWKKDGVEHSFLEGYEARGGDEEL